MGGTPGLQDPHIRLRVTAFSPKANAQAVHFSHDISYPFSVFDNRLNLMLYSFTKADESIRLGGIHHNGHACSARWRSKQMVTANGAKLLATNVPRVKVCFSMCSSRNQCRRLSASPFHDCLNAWESPPTVTSCSKLLDSGCHLPDPSRPCLIS